MERILQYMDDLEDLYFAFALLAERIRRGLQVAALVITSFLLQFLGVLLALSRPPIALAFVFLAVVAMLYRSVTGGAFVQGA